MNLVKPSYFDKIQTISEDNWDYFDKNPNIAGPFWLLLEQLNSPRHVVSELLQNADDAEATEVSINIVDGVFQFTHNGHDFEEGEFSSICNFGYSNKRLLHTIGFRGIGFKSTFSLGPTVELNTPTLRVAFHKKRFTYPVWTDLDLPEDGNTQIVVKIIDQKTEKEIINSMDSWLKSPLSLLFFNNVRKLNIGGEELHWENLGPGPVENSRWMTLKGTQTSHLFIRSKEEAFPEESIAEIRESRRLLDTDKTDLPPCKIEIAVGARGEIFSVLPTGVTTPFTFAMNAPFMQDPARQSIKNPEFSPTNQWLLKRIGQLAASVMLEWLHRDDLPIGERVKAYDILPGPDLTENPIQIACAKEIKRSLIDGVEGQTFVLSEDGSLAVTGNSVSIPSVLWKIWTSEQIVSILDRSLISRYINADYLHKLSLLGAIGIFSTDDIKAILVKTNPPKPESYAALLELWNYVGNWLYFSVSGKIYNQKDINVFPVKDKNVLFAAKRIIRLGEKKVQMPDEDWDLLTSHHELLDTSFLSFLNKQKQEVADGKNPQLSEKLSQVERLIKAVELDEAFRFDNLINELAKRVFDQFRPPLGECIKVTQLAAKFTIKNNGKIKFWTVDGKLHELSSSKMPLIFDAGGILEEFIPPKVREQVLLHPDYSKEFTSCTKEEWSSWMQSGLSGIASVMPIYRQDIDFLNKDELHKLILARGYKGSLTTNHYRSNRFFILDFDFYPASWEYWMTAAKDDKTFWGRLLMFYLKNPESIKDTLKASAHQVATSLHCKPSTNEPVMPSWIMEFQKRECLPDTNGLYRYPSELMRRTRETEPLMDLGSFVDFNFDKPDLYPLLDLLGVHTKPSGPKQVLERLRMLSRVQNPPLSGLIKIYEQLDSLFSICTTLDQQEIRDILHNEEVIFAEDGTWQTSEFIFVNADEGDVPDAAVVHPAVRQLSLWRKAGVTERPTADLAVNWLSTKISKGKKIPQPNLNRVRSLLQKHPVRIWIECRSWLNLSGEWISIQDIHYASTKQSHISNGKYFNWVEAKTADFRMLMSDTALNAPFNGVPPLTSKLEKRIDYSAPHGQHIRFASLECLGRLLMRIQLKDERDLRVVQEQAERLSKTTGIQIEEIITTPYLDGEPAGPKENEAIAWVGQTLYFTDLSVAKFTKLIIDKVAGAFGWSEMRDILAYCYDRSELAIRAYLEGNYELSEEDTSASHENSEEDRAENPDRSKAEQLLPTDNQNNEPSKWEEDNNKNSEDSNIVTDDGDFYNNNGNNDGVDDDYDNDDSYKDNQPDSKTGPKRKHSPSSPLIERFAFAHGFHRNGNQQYVHPDGRFLRRSEGIFHWEMSSSKDTSIQRFWVRDHCLEAKPIEMPTEVWHILDSSPSENMLLLKDLNNDPITYSGNQLKLLKDEGRLTLHSAIYRIVLDTND